MKKNFVGVFAGFLLLFFVTRNIDFERVISILGKTNFYFILLGISIIFLLLILKTWRWQLILGGSRIQKITLFRILTIGYLVNFILPARAGELARIYLVGRREKIGIGKTFGSILLEKILDTIFLILIAFGLNLFSYRFLIFGLGINQKWQDKFHSLFSGFESLKEKKSLAVLIFMTALIWSLEGLWNYSLFAALNLPLSYWTALFLAVFVNLGLFFPSPPGYWGVFEFLIVTALTFVGVEKTQAFSYAILQHLIESLFLITLGVWSALKISFNPFGKKWQKN